METPADRLRSAREKRYPTAKAAAEAMGVGVSTYIGHENGSRGITVSQAAKYARWFRVPEAWILYGKGGAEDFVPDDEFEDAVKEVVREIDPDRHDEALDLLRILARKSRRNRAA